jgi:hypothetical protein
MTFYEVCIDFWTIGSTFQAFYGRFVAVPSRQLLAQMEAIMTHFVTLTVPSPRTDHNLRHSTTRVGLLARRVRILFFRDFRHQGQFF